MNQQEEIKSLRSKHIFANQREYIAILNKRRHLARMKFEEYCKPNDKILERICPPLEQCLVTSLNQDQIKQYSLRKLLERKEDANQFLHNFNRRKRFTLSSFLNSDDSFKEKYIHERRREGLALYEDYCESTHQLPRSCPPIDRCKCGDCDT
ncbi:unnamed protein product [Adineta steineri]|uniref:Uncharacterized protein n=1 Tax=Adineta steineri TaxID=433720 RepID=A0A815GJA4_9BILA|nr:unnamed protein product [Adineta steineri]CAF3583183.1 unnamed protein product [Adineta steineri]